ncbi:hypothetical protein Tco_1046536 [Tanacetum coccineum]
MLTKTELTLEQTQKGVSDEVLVLTMTMEILLEPTSNKLSVGDLWDSHESDLFQVDPHGFEGTYKDGHREMLKKFGFENSKVTKTLMSMKRVITLDKCSESIDSTKYKGMIGSLLYLTASRPDIMFSVFLGARFQEDPKVSHLEPVKRIFRKMSNSEGSMNKGKVGESSKKLKRKFKTMKGYEDDERIMFEFILRGFTESEICDKVKEPLSPKLNVDDVGSRNTSLHRIKHELERERRKKELF